MVECSQRIMYIGHPSSGVPFWYPSRPFMEVTWPIHSELPCHIMEACSASISEVLSLIRSQDRLSPHAAFTFLSYRRFISAGSLFHRLMQDVDQRSPPSNQIASLRFLALWLESRFQVDFSFSSMRSPQRSSRICGMDPLLRMSLRQAQLVCTPFTKSGTGLWVTDYTISGGNQTRPLTTRDSATR